MFYKNFHSDRTRCLPALYNALQFQDNKLVMMQIYKNFHSKNYRNYHSTYIPVLYGVCNLSEMLKCFRIKKVGKYFSFHDAFLEEK
jgi:hypothetical protein